MTYVTQIIMLYTLNLYSAVCQLYLNEAGRKKDAGPKLWRTFYVLIETLDNTSFVIFFY